MSVNEDAERQTMADLKAIADHYERRGIAGPGLIEGLRYELAVRANDLNGDDCRFPMCPCLMPDCAQRVAAAGG